MLKPKPYIDVETEPVQNLSDVDLSLTYSYAHYLNWLFEDRVELIKGKVFKMSPAPSRLHQKISGQLFNSTFNFLKNKGCEVYTAPFDVRFPRASKEDKDIFTVLQPDICVVCDHSKLDDRGCIGAPDLVIEILSPGNTKTELFYKYEVYEEFGVKEYWVVSQSDQTILIYTLNQEGKFQPSKLFALGEKVSSSVLVGFELELNDVFAQ